MVQDAEIKFEYSNADFHTAQLFVHDHALDNKTLTIKLSVQKTDCKAKETCGVVEESQPAETACCSPESGCC